MELVSMDKSQRNIPFIITIFYFISFLFIRLSVYLAGSVNNEIARAVRLGADSIPRFHLGRNIILFGYHIHHFYIGIFLICVAGWISIVGASLLTRKQTAALYGIGLGLFMDEIGLLLTWGDYYSGLSYLLSLFLGGVFLNVIFFPHFWREVREKLVRMESQSIFMERVSRRSRFLKLIDSISEKMSRTEKASLIFSGVLSLLMCVFILMVPQSLRYGVSSLFIIQGLVFLVRSWGK